LDVSETDIGIVSLIDASGSSGYVPERPGIDCLVIDTYITKAFMAFCTFIAGAAMMPLNWIKTAKCVLKRQISTQLQNIRFRKSGVRPHDLNGPVQPFGQSFRKTLKKTRRCV
jgi:hypothetical protein